MSQLELPRWSATAKRVLHQHMTTVEEHDIVTPDGRSFTMPVILTTTLGCAFVLPVHDDGTVTLVAQHRYVQDLVTLEAAAGTIDAGETPEQGARRELAEEAGVAGGTYIPLGEFPSGTIIDERGFMFLAFGCEPIEGWQPEEDCRPVRMNLDEAIGLIGDGALTPCAALLLLAAKSHLAS